MKTALAAAKIRETWNLKYEKEESYNYVRGSEKILKKS